MAKKIEAWVEFGPRIELAPPMTPEEIIENIIQATNQSRGSVKAILDELDVQIENGLRSGRDVRVNPRIVKNLHVNFCGQWRSAENIGKTEARIIAKWNEPHPDNPVETESQPEPGGD